MKKDNLRFRRLINFLGSKKFFWLITGFFVFEAAWIACTALYPMAFDEDFHLGLIKLYAHHVSPFWDGHPAGSDAFGALTRDPSYLYHYLMSFPYRLISVFTADQTVQVMILRFLNIGFVAYALLLYRKLLLKTRASGALVNLSLAIFILVPILPYLAGQINYDNLLLPLVAYAFLLTLKLCESMKRKSLDAKTLLLLSSVLLATSLVKYAFLPIFVIIIVYLFTRAYRVYKTPKKLWIAIAAGVKILSRSTLWGLVALILLTGTLFVERYGVNIIKYHAPVADCGEVLDYGHCKSYGPWIRDYNLEKDKGNPNLSVGAFNNSWFQGMWFRSFFAISGVTNSYQNSGPLTYPALGAVVFASTGILAFVLMAKKLFKKYSAPVLWLLLASSLFYVVVLWLDNYQMYLQDGKAVAINGRYLLPVLPVAVLLTAMAINMALGARTKLKVALGGLVLLCFLWGGGTLTYILRSHDSWYWPNGPLNGTNRFIIRDIGPYIPGFRHPEQYMP